MVSDISDKYHLGHPTYKLGMVRGMEGEAAYPGNKLMVVGGGAVQLYAMHTRPNPQSVLRATTDVDFVINRTLTKPERRIWGDFVAKSIETQSEGKIKTKSELGRNGPSVRITNLSPDLLLHLDCYSQRYFDAHKRSIDEEFERASFIDVDGVSIRHSYPTDIIAGKLQRINTIVGYGEVKPTEIQSEFIRSLKEGRFDDVNVNNLEELLATCVVERKQNIEDLARLGYAGIRKAICTYKLHKDFYDMLLVVDGMRNVRQDVNVNEYRKHVERMLQ